VDDARSRGLSAPTSNGQLDDPAVAPAVLGLRPRADSGDARRIGRPIENARAGCESTAADADADGGLGAEVLDPLRAVAVLGDDVIPAGVCGEPDLDLARPACAPPPGGQVEKLRLFLAIDTSRPVS
jgi:hypothetical protein